MPDGAQTGRCEVLPPVIDGGGKVCSSSVGITKLKKGGGGETNGMNICKNLSNPPFGLQACPKILVPESEFLGHFESKGCKISLIFE